MPATGGRGHDATGTPFVHRPWGSTGSIGPLGNIVHQIERRIDGLLGIRNQLELVAQTLAPDDFIRTFVVDSCARLQAAEEGLTDACTELYQYADTEIQRQQDEITDRERNDREREDRERAAHARAHLADLLSHPAPPVQPARQGTEQTATAPMPTFRGDQILDQLKLDMQVLRDGSLLPEGLDELRRGLACLQDFLKPYIGSTEGVAGAEGRRDSAEPAAEPAAEPTVVVYEPSSIESLALEVVNMGQVAFDTRDYLMADRCFKQALSLALQLASERRQNVNIFDLEYRIATLSPWTGDPQSAKQTMVRFVQTAAASNGVEAAEDVAYAQHLLAQVHLQLGNLQEAEMSCRVAIDARLKLGVPDAQLHVSYALLARIYTLQNNDILARAALEKVPQDTRELLKTTYSSLTTPDQPIQEITLPILPFQGQLIPARNLLPEPALPGDTGSSTDLQTTQPIPSARPPPDQDDRRNILRVLNLHTHPPALEDAMVRGDLAAVQTILGPEDLTWRPSRSLHIAALFGETEMAEALIRKNGSVNGLCTTTSARPGALSHNVTPLHLAIGARHEAMIRLLVRHGAGLLPSDFVMGSSRASAPPLWLISERWISLTRCTDPQEIIDIMQVLISLGLDINAPLNLEGQTMLRLARSLPDDSLTWVAFKDPIVRFLEQRARQRVIEY